MVNRNLNYEKLFNQMVNFTYDYIWENGLESAILGISGGIDSTVVAALLYEVSKKHNEWFKSLSDDDIEKNNYNTFLFYGFSLPTKTTHPTEYHVSQLVGNAFCRYEECLLPSFFTDNIDECANFISRFVRVQDKDGNVIDAFRNGNIKSRLRMVYLYDKAKEHNGFVVGTDNYTEKLLGFSTIGGDALADYMPLQYLWKTEVYGLANYLLEKYKKEENWGAVHAISESIKLIPQDGLGISTSDMGQIGAKNYYEVDEILYTFENLHVSLSTFMKSKEYSDLCNKFKKDVVDKVLWRRVRNFKLKLPLEFINDDVKQILNTEI